MSVNKGDYSGLDLQRNVTDEPEPRPPRQPNGNAGTRGTGGLIVVEPLRKQDMQQSYAQELSSADADNHGFYGTVIHCLGGIAGTMGAVPFCFCCPNPYKQVAQGNVGLVSKFGRFYKATDPGLVKINPFSEKVRMVNVQIQVVPIPKQTVLTRDNVTVYIDSVLYFHVTNPYKAAFAISDIRSAIVERAQSTLRHVVGSRLLQNLITEREEIAHEIEEILEQVSSSWGIAVESILIKDIIFSEELQQSLSAAAQQKRIGESKVIAARAEVDAARLMREAADILASPAAMQIRQLDSLQAMARTSNAKVIFMPMPVGQFDAALASNNLPGLAQASGSRTNNFGAAGETAQIHQLANM